MYLPLFKSVSPPPPVQCGTGANGFFCSLSPVCLIENILNCSGNLLVRNGG